jgi:hypothetical protein
MDHHLNLYRSQKLIEASYRRRRRAWRRIAPLHGDLLFALALINGPPPTPEKNTPGLEIRAREKSEQKLEIAGTHDSEHPQ